MDLFICEKTFWYILVFCVSCFRISSGVGSAAKKEVIERNALACEGGVMPLRCPPNMRIHIKWANYGRYSLSVCNQHRVTERWSTRCMSVRSLSIVSERCHDRQSCVIQVQNNLFGDPCPDTVKYLEVRYHCKPGGSPFRPPLTEPTMANTTVEPTTPAPPTPPTTTTTTTTTTRQTTTARRPSRPAPLVTARPSAKCDAMVAREVSWPESMAGMVVRQCPTGMTGQARWYCSNKGWVGNPDLSLCLSKISQDLKDLSKDENSEFVAKELEAVTKTQPLFGGDLVSASEVMHSVAKKLREDLNKEREQEEKQEKANDVNAALVNSTSNMLSEKQENSWKDLPKRKQTQVATTLMDSMLAVAFELAETLDTTAKVTSSSVNVLMKVEKVESRSVMRDIVFPEETEHKLPNATNAKLLDDKIVLPASVLAYEAQITGKVTVVFTVIDNIAQYMKTNQTRNDTNTTVIVNTNVISASINSKVSIKLREPVVYTMKHMMTKDVANPVCVFWDYAETNMIGEWSREGCKLRDTNVTHTECECDHLTNFAVLMDVVGTKLDHAHEMSLQIITYAGCVVSIVCLFLAFLTFQCFRNLQSDRNTIHKNLCMSLLLAEIIFLAGIMQYRHVILCAVIAGVLHFLFLASFAWMCLEGVQLYVMLIEVFEAERSRVKWYYLSGYGIPALVVAIAAGVHHEGYGTERHCWLRTDTYFIWAFVGPVIAVITVNIVMLSIAIYMMCRHAQMASSLKTKEKSRLQNINERSHSITCEDVRLKQKLANTAAWIKGAVILVVLLGLTWAFGLLYISADSVVMAYVFTVMNTLQGLFIFIFHCIMNDKVQKEYKKCVRRSSWMPEWIRVAYGGQPAGYNVGSSGTPNSRSNSTAGNYLTRFLSGRRRKKSSTTSLPKSIVIKNPQVDEYSSVFNETDGSEKCHRVHPQDNAIRNGDVLGDLSFIDASIVDTDFVSEYCQNNMMVTMDGVNNKTKIPLNVKNRFSGFSEPGDITESEYSDTELFKMTDYDSKPRNYIVDRKPSTIKEELEQDGYEVPSHLRTPSEKNLIENQAPADKNIVDKIMGPLGLLHKKHPPSCQNLSSIQEGLLLEDSTLCKSTPNLQYKPPATPPKEPEQSNRDSFGVSMPNLAYINDAYEHDSTVPSDDQKLLNRNSMLRRSDSDPGRNLNWPKRASNCSDC